MRREDTACTRVQVVEPLVGDMRVAQIVLVTCCNAPFGQRGVV